MVWFKYLQKSTRLLSTRSINLIGIWLFFFGSIMEVVQCYCGCVMKLGDVAANLVGLMIARLWAEKMKVKSNFPQKTNSPRFIIKFASH